MSAIASALENLVNAALTVERQFGPRTRRTWAGQSRVHVEVREGRATERAALARCLEADVMTLPGVLSVRFIAAIGRVVVELDAGGPALEDIVAAVERAEQSAGLEKARFRETGW